MCLLHIFADALLTIGSVVKGKTVEGSDSDADICWSSLQYYFTDM